MFITFNFINKIDLNSRLHLNAKLILNVLCYSRLGVERNLQPLESVLGQNAKPLYANGSRWDAAWLFLMVHTVAASQMVCDAANYKRCQNNLTNLWYLIIILLCLAANSSATHTHSASWNSFRRPTMLRCVKYVGQHISYVIGVLGCMFNTCFALIRRLLESQQRKNIPLSDLYQLVSLQQSAQSVAT